MCDNVDEYLVWVLHYGYGMNGNTPNYTPLVRADLHGN